MKDNQNKEQNEVQSVNKFNTYPEGFMRAAEALDFLPEEERADVLLGTIMAAMMETV